MSKLTNLELAAQQGSQGAPNLLKALKENFYDKEEVDKKIAEVDNPFKGWFNNIEALYTAQPLPLVGDYAYVADPLPATTTSIYECASLGVWIDSGRDVDTSSVQTFASGEEVNNVHIVDDLTTGGSDNVLSAEAGKDLNTAVEYIYKVEEIVPETEVVEFDGSGEASFNTIELSQNGDYLEVDIKCAASYFEEIRQCWAFLSYMTTDRETAVAISHYIIGLKNEGGSWLQGMNAASGQLNITDYGVLTTRGKIKIAYEDNNINIYLRGSLIHTVSTQSTIKINRAGKYGAYYWKGIIYSFKYHHENTTINKLSDLPGFTYNSEHIDIDPDPSSHEYVESGRLVDLEERVDKLEESVERPLRIERTGEKSFSIYSTNKQGAILRYTWYRNQYTRPIGENGADIVCGDVWNQEMIKIASGADIIQGNGNFTFSIDGTKSGVDGDNTQFENESKNYYAGPGHGCEVAIYTIFLADGKEINPTELTEPLYCNIFKEICLSNCYAVDSTHNTDNENNYPKLDNSYNPIVSATHYMEWELSEDNSIHEYNRLIVKRDGTVFGALYAAMLQCYVPYFKDILINDNNGSWVEVGEPESGSDYISHTPKYGTSDFIWHAVKAYRATSISNNHNVTVTQAIQSIDASRLDKLNIYTAPYNNRFKCYFQPAITTLSSYGWETFNNGDKFEILVDRKIEVSKEE